MKIQFTALAMFALVAAITPAVRAQVPVNIPLHCQPSTLPVDFPEPFIHLTNTTSVTVSKGDSIFVLESDNSNKPNGHFTLTAASDIPPKGVASFNVGQPNFMNLFLTVLSLPNGYAEVCTAWVHKIVSVPASFNGPKVVGQVKLPASAYWQKVK